MPSEIVNDENMNIIFIRISYNKRVVRSTPLALQEMDNNECNKVRDKRNPSNLITAIKENQKETSAIFLK